MKVSNDVWAIIPAYNESRKITKVISNVKKYCKNITVVDDGSKDSTAEVAELKGVVVLRHIINLGKGAALKTGCDFAVKKGAKVIIAIDADGQHNPKEIPYFINTLKGKDIVFGYRKFTKTMPFIFRFGNSFINLVIKLLYGINLMDTQCGYRAFTSSAYKKIRWNALDYTMESEMIANAGKHNLRHSEIEVETIYEDRHKGTTVFDGIKIVFDMIIWRFRG